MTIKLLALGPGYLLICLSWFCLANSLQARDWLTFGHDPQRSGWAVEEKILTAQNVSGMELKWKVQVKNEPKALTALTAPVVAAEVTTPQGIKTLVYVAGSSNLVSALDADNGNPVWSRNLETYAKASKESDWLCPQGINATPVIDKRTAIIYTIAMDGRLYGLDLGTGKNRFGPIQFVPPFSKNWSLNLVDGIIYTSLSQGCGGGQSGIYSMDVRDPFRPVIRNLLVSNGGGGGIWGRGGPVVGRNGRIYAATGDGPFDPSTGEYSNTILAASLGDLKLCDYYTPTNWRDIFRYDWDLGCSSPVWFAHKDYHLLAAGGKEGVAYLMDADSLGDKDHQTPLYITPRLANDEDTFEGKGIWGGLSAWRDLQDQTWVYVPILGPVSKHSPKFPKTNGPNPHGSLMAFKVALDITSKKPILEPAWISGELNVPEPVVIANGIVWALSNGEDVRQTKEGGVINFQNLTLLTAEQRKDNPNRAVLCAFDAQTGKMLYQSGSALDTWTHFGGLALANGRVYIADHNSQVYCFGLKGK
ncbi:MAG: pyrrolo-quinoline quinone [Acidobacteria bacterium]|nr:MAG: pyrrolo-quinoline quinone [Acidobacteriota bacterium]